MSFPYNGTDAVAIGTLAGKNSQGTGMANTSFKSSGHNVELTVGRSTISNATAAQSTNIVTGTTPVTLPATSTAFYMAGTENGSGKPSNLNGFAIDFPQSPTDYYYTIWMSSSTSHNYTDMTAALTVLQVQP